MFQPSASRDRLNRPAALQGVEPVALDMPVAEVLGLGLLHAEASIYWQAKGVASAIDLLPPKVTATALERVGLADVGCPRRLAVQLGEHCPGQLGGGCNELRDHVLPLFSLQDGLCYCLATGQQHDDAER